MSERDKSLEPTTEDARDIVRKCPHCGGLIEIHAYVRVKLKGHNESKTAEAELNVKPKAEPQDHQQAIKQRVIENIRCTPILDIFSAVVNVVKPDHIPKNMAEFFFTFLCTAKVRILPKKILRLFMGVCPDTRIEYWASQGIGMITASGQIRYFISDREIRGIKIENTTLRHGSDLGNAEDWIRTRFGFVPLECQIFLAELIKTPHGKLPREKQLFRP